MNWIFSIRYWDSRLGQAPAVNRWAVVGSARASTVEAALHLAKVPEQIRVEIRSHAFVREFVEGRLDSDRTGYYVQSDPKSHPGWVVCIGPVHEVLS